MKSGSSPLGVIPARAESSRFPNKVIAKIREKPMIQYVWEAASRSKRLASLVVATDSLEVASVVKGFGGEVRMTPSGFANGTERVAYVAKESDAEIIVNLQGDEPLLPPEAIDRLVDELERTSAVGLATLAVRKRSRTDLLDPNVVKVVMSESGEALYFSRKPLEMGLEWEFLKHIGIYAYRRETLLRLCRLPKSSLEEIEKLEQLRALENGIRIKMVLIETDTIAVDVPSDILRVENYLNEMAKDETT